MEPPKPVFSSDFISSSVSLPWKVIPLLGEMSAKQTKGCPFPEEKGDHEVVDESKKLPSPQALSLRKRGTTQWWMSRKSYLLLKSSL